MNTIDSKEHNEALIVIWNHVAEKSTDQEIIDYANSKVKQLSELYEAKKQSDLAHKEFDKAYMLLIEKEIREVKKYA